MFTTPCFIRKNTPEIRKKLEELGYYRHPSTSLKMDGNRDGNKLFCNRGFYSEIPIGYIEEINKTINCDNNVDLFLAIAALRDDTDANQWFTDGKLWEKTEAELPSKYMQMHGHKATIEELIEYFK